MCPAQCRQDDGGCGLRVSAAPRCALRGREQAKRAARLSGDLLSPRGRGEWRVARPGCRRRLWDAPGVRGQRLRALGTGQRPWPLRPARCSQRQASLGRVLPGGGAP